MVSSDMMSNLLSYFNYNNYYIMVKNIRYSLNNFIELPAQWLCCSLTSILRCSACLMSYKHHLVHSQSLSLSGNLGDMISGENPCYASQ